MAWLTGWTYRKSITLSRTAGAVTNYQMRLLVGESSGAVGEDVDCGGKVLASFNDLRFTTSDEVTLLDYWIDSITGTTPNRLATVWIEFNSIGTGATTFYMYYGKSDATAYSNGINTFGTGNLEDFEWGSNGSSLVPSGGNVTWTIVGGVAQISTAYAFSGTRSGGLINNAAQNDIQFPVSASNAKALLCRFYKADAVLTTNIIMHGNGTRVIQIYCDVSENLYYSDGTAYLIATFSPGAWHTLEICNINWTAYTYDIYLNNSLVKSGAAMRTFASYNGIWRLQQNANSGNGFNFDNIIVRQYANPEPSWGTWGSEEIDVPPLIGASFVAWIN